MSRTPTRVLFVAAAVAMGIAPTDGWAQTTFTACWVPGVGAIYMIGQPGLPGSCLDPGHVEFSWTEGGAPAEGSVTESTIADDAVTSSKLADGAVLSAHIAEGAVGSSALGLEVVEFTNSAARTSSVFQATATCPAGKRPLAGGYLWWLFQPENTTDAVVTENRPAGDSWSVTVRDPSPYGLLSLRAYAVCIAG